MPRLELSADLAAAGVRPLRIALVVSRTNEFITERLLEGAVGRLRSAGITDPMIVDVAGAYEVVSAAATAFDAGFDGVVALGAIVRGETPHFDYIAQGVTFGLTELAVQGKLITFGVLTVDSVAQGMERAGGALGNKGAEAAEALLQLITARARLVAAGGDQP